MHVRSPLVSPKFLWSIRTSAAFHLKIISVEPCRTPWVSSAAYSCHLWGYRVEVEDVSTGSGSMIRDPANGCSCRDQEAMAEAGKVVLVQVLRPAV